MKRKTWIAIYFGLCILVSLAALPRGGNNTETQSRFSPVVSGAECHPEARSTNPAAHDGCGASRHAPNERFFVEQPDGSGEYGGLSMYPAAQRMRESFHGKLDDSVAAPLSEQGISADTLASLREQLQNAPADGTVWSGTSDREFRTE